MASGQFVVLAVVDVVSLEVRGGDSGGERRWSPLGFLSSWLGMTATFLLAAPLLAGLQIKKKNSFFMNVLERRQDIGQKKTQHHIESKSEDTKSFCKPLKSFTSSIIFAG